MTATAKPTDTPAPGERKAKRRAISRAREAAAAGRVVSDEKVMTWLDSWGTDAETARPKCD
jgi:predicted transcriptional regulator